jgi:S1-C subfamily serine protease
MSKSVKSEKCNKKKYLTIGGLAFGFLVVCCLVLSQSESMPKTPKEAAFTSVKITNMQQSSGGSGVILSSADQESIILTNRHVCGVIEHGGLVVKDNVPHAVAAYKPSENHDLCEIRVRVNLGVDTVVASRAPKRYSAALISGHPQLLPHVTTLGQFSGRIVINVLTKIRKCTQEEAGDPSKAMICAVLGGIPEVKSFDSQLVSGLIMPGSSGSAVFNDNGEIAGLVFAGSSRELSFAFIVPQEYVADFVNREVRGLPWLTPAPLEFGAGPGADSKEKIKHIQDFTHPIYE